MTRTDIEKIAALRLNFEVAFHNRRDGRRPGPRVLEKLDEATLWRDINIIRRCRKDATQGCDMAMRVKLQSPEVFATRTEWHLQKMDEMRCSLLSQLRQSKQLRHKGQPICNTCWMNLHGVSKGHFYDLQRRASAKHAHNSTSNVLSSGTLRRRTDHFVVQAIEWMRQHFMLAGGKCFKPRASRNLQHAACANGMRGTGALQPLLLRCPSASCSAGCACCLLPSGLGA